MSLIKTLLVVVVIAAIVVEAPVIWKKQSADTRKQVVSWLPTVSLPSTLLHEEPKPKEVKTVGMPKQKPKVYESQGHHGEVEFSDGQNVNRSANVRVVSDAKGVTLYTNASDKRND